MLYYITTVVYYVFWGRCKCRGDNCLGGICPGGGNFGGGGGGKSLLGQMSGYRHNLQTKTKQEACLGTVLSNDVSPHIDARIKTVRVLFMFYNVLACARIE